MCGRYGLVAELNDLSEMFGFTADGVAYTPSYNIAPTQMVLTVVNKEGPRASLMRWGLIPHWAKDMSVGSRMINARAEAVAEKPAFRAALRRQRCLVLADSFYEWQREGKAKRPMRIKLESGEPFAFAGLWDSWGTPAGETIESCTIITTEPNGLLRPIHNRMPVILPREVEEAWLDEGLREPAALHQMLVPIRREPWTPTRSPAWSTCPSTTVRS